MLVNFRSKHPIFLQTHVCLFGCNKFNIDIPLFPIVLIRGLWTAWGQINLPSETGGRTKTDIYNFLSVTIIVSCVHLEISNYNKNLLTPAPSPQLASSSISGSKIPSYSLFHWAVPSPPLIPRPGITSESHKRCTRGPESEYSDGRGGVKRIINE